MMSSKSLAVHALLVAALSSLGSAQASVVAVIKDPVLSSGTDAIDPAGSQTVDTIASVSGGNILTPKETLCARNDLKVVQTFTSGSSGSGLYSGGIGGTANTEVISLTDASLPDIQLSMTGTTSATSGSELGLSSRCTSGTSSIGLSGPASAYSYNLTLTFGSYDESSGVFTSGVNFVAANGFTLGNVRTGITVTVDYLDGAGNVLCTQISSGGVDVSPDGTTGTTSGKDIYFGYATADGSHSIASTVITISSTTGANTAMGLDDIAFTTVPEPATLAIAGVGGAALLMKRRR